MATSNAINNLLVAMTKKQQQQQQKPKWIGSITNRDNYIIYIDIANINE